MESLKLVVYSCGRVMNKKAEIELLVVIRLLFFWGKTLAMFVRASCSTIFLEVSLIFLMCSC